MRLFCNAVYTQQKTHMLLMHTDKYQCCVTSSVCISLFWSIILSVVGNTNSMWILYLVSSWPIFTYTHYYCIWYSQNTTANSHVGLKLRREANRRAREKNLRLHTSNKLFSHVASAVTPTPCCLRLPIWFQLDYIFTYNLLLKKNGVRRKTLMKWIQRTR